MTWIIVGVALVTVVLVYIIFDLLWRPERRALRGEIPRSVLSLLRLYEDGSSVLVDLREGSTSLFRFCRAGTAGEGCGLLFEIFDSPLVSGHRDDLLKEFTNRGYEPIQEYDGERTSPPLLMTVRFDIPNIWLADAGDRAAEVAETALDVLGIDRATKFRLKFRGARSVDRTLELRRRQKRGEKVAW